MARWRRLLVATVLVGALLAGSAPTASAVTVAESGSIYELTRADDFDGEDADILRLYWAFFNREPDLPGAKHWLSLAPTRSMVDFAWAFANSDEFLQRYGQTNDREFLQIVYENVLGRAYDQGGFDYWLGEMAAGLSRPEVVLYIAAGIEFRNAHPYPDPNARPPTGPVAGEPIVVHQGDGDARFPVDWGPLPVVIDIRHPFHGHFSVLTRDRNDLRGKLLVNGTDPYAGRVGAQFVGDDEVAFLEVNADHPWTITVHPLSVVQRVSGDAAGSGDDVLSLERFDDQGGTVRIRHGGRIISIWAWDGRGGRDLLVTDFHDNVFLDVTAEVEAGYHLFEINADGDWTLDVD